MMPLPTVNVLLLPTVTSPALLKGPEVVMFAPFRMVRLLMEDALAIDKLPAEILMAAWLVRLLIVSDADVLCVIVIPEVLITASSAKPGSTPPLQLAGVS